MTHARTFTLLAILSLLQGEASRVVAEMEEPRLSIRFTDRAILFDGEVDSEETGQELARAAQSIRPDLPLRNRGLRVDPETEVPPIPDLKSLLTELGLSTHGGGIAFYEDRVVLSGMTDSVITVTAVQIRMESLLEKRRLENRLCIVSPADMPDPAVRLSTGLDGGSLLDFDRYPGPEESFIPPGVAPRKLAGTLALMSRFEEFLDPSERTKAVPVRAVPAPLAPEEAAPSEGPPPPEQAPSRMRAVPAGPITTYIHLEPIRFSRNSFLLQAGTRETIGQLVQQLSAPPLAGRRILLKSRQWQSSSAAFAEYLAERRAEEAEKLLVEAGIPAERIEATVEKIPSSLDEGEVLVVVEIPPEEEPEEESPENAREAPEVSEEPDPASEDAAPVAESEETESGRTDQATDRP